MDENNTLNPEIKKYFKAFKEDKIQYDNIYKEYRNTNNCIENLINADALLDDSRLLLENEIKKILKNVILTEKIKTYITNELINIGYDCDISKLIDN